MADLYIKASSSDNDTFNVDLETLILIFIYKLSKSKNINLCINVDSSFSTDLLFSVNFSSLKYFISHDTPVNCNYCSWPVIITGSSVVSGLAAVSRKIIKCSDERFKTLLGFREACLMACNESSIWTKFCEIDIVSTVKNLLLNHKEYFYNNSLKIPDDLVRFEHHLEQPVRIHNIYKLARKHNNDKSIKSSVPITELNMEHIFSEGPFMTLADIILFPCIKIVLESLQIRHVKHTLPLVVNWYENMLNQEIIPQFDFEITQTVEIQVEKFLNISDEKVDIIFEKNVPKQSLYISDPNRYRPQSRMYTKQEDIEKITNFIKDKVDFSISNCSEECLYDDVNFDWSTVPNEAAPCSGALPEKRVIRKTQQLENLAKATVKLAGDSSLTIVDFCSGSGHLGILVASLLPKCKIILVENKEKSLARAIERVKKINLENVIFLQCNLDYFKAKFDIGLALHACGVATDLVIQTCLDNKASFVCCPCCYGSIHSCHHLSYPRSQKFQDVGISYEDFIILCHAADQTHQNNSKTSQGYFCMNVVDSDRKFYAEQLGYTVHLGKLSPPSCTPKNNILIGLIKKC